MSLRLRQICLVAYQLEPVIETREWLETICLDSILLEQREGSKPLNFRKTL